VLFPAAESVGAIGHVTGIDLSEGMVQETNREIKNRQMANVEVRQMDAEYLQLADQSFDYVLCGLSIFFFPQLDRALSEFSRVLKPGGRIAWTTSHELFEEEWSWFEKLIGAYLEPRDKEPANEGTEDSPDEQEPVFNSAEGVERIMREAGFTGIEIDSETADFIYADEETYWDSIYSTAIRATLERIEKVHGRDGLERFRNELFAALKKKKGADGIHQQFSVLYAVGIKPE
jgi:O-methyltransferase/aklanonic acid methyltransferase